MVARFCPGDVSEVLGALFSVFFIWLVSGVLCYIAVERIMHEHYKDVKADEMLVTAGLGVVFNIVYATDMSTKLLPRFPSS